MLRSALSWKDAWRVRIVALGIIVLCVGIGSQVLVNAVAADSEVMTLQVTVYTASARMADGNWTHLGACAVSVTQLPLGSVIALYTADGSFNRQCTAEDTNGTIADGHMLLAMPGDAAGAMQWGVRYLSAEVIRYGWGEDGPPRPIATVVKSDQPFHNVKPRFRLTP